MTLQNAVEKISALHPHPFDNDTVTAWLSELEGRIKVRVFKKKPSECVAYTYAGDKGKTLEVPYPYDGMYISYASCKIDLADEDYQRYNADKADFDILLDEYAKYCQRSGDTL